MKPDNLESNGKTDRERGTSIPGTKPEDTDCDKWPRGRQWPFYFAGFCAFSFTAPDKLMKSFAAAMMKIVSNKT